jgi:hypothetical protein
VLFNHGLWPAAMEIWRQGPYGGQANPLVVRREDAVWVDGELTANGLAPMPFAELAKKASRAWPGHRRHGARLQPLELGRGRLRHRRCASACRSMAWR